MKPLTKTMQSLIEHMRNHGGVLYRHPGGFWTEHSCYNLRATSFGTGSIEALVSRGIAQYVDWKDGRNGRFPVKAQLVEVIQ